MTRRVIVSLTIANSRELLRDRKTAAASLLLPVFFLGLFVTLSLLMEPGRDSEAIEVLLPAAMFFVLSSIAMSGTATPAVDLRRRGTLRLLSTTPLRPSTFLLSLAPSRLAIALTFVTISLVVSQLFGFLQLERVLPAFAVCLAGLAMFAALGFVVAARLDSVDAANNVLSFAQIVLILIAGGLIPSSRVPDAVGKVMEWLPPGLLLDSLEHTIVGAGTPHPLWVTLLLLSGSSSALGLLAVRVFRWNRDVDG